MPLFPSMRISAFPPAAAALLALALRGAAGAAVAPSAIVPATVTKVDPKGVGAGRLVAGDRLIRWRRASGVGAPAAGELAAPFDVERMSREEFPRGPLVLDVEREGKPLVVTLGAGRWGLELRPSLPAPVSEALDRAESWAERDQPEAAAALLEAIAAGERDRALRCWLLLRAAPFGDDESRERLFEEAVIAAGPDRALLARAWERRSEARIARRDGEGARESLVRFLALEEPEGLRAARGWSRWSEVEADRSPELEESFLRCAEALERRLAPESLVLAATLNALATAGNNSGNLREAEALLIESLALRERHLPGSAEVASTMTNLGINARLRSRLAEAERWHRQALAIREAIEPGGIAAAQSMNNLGRVAHNRGDLAAAERWYREGLAIQERIRPGGTSEATVAENLANVLADRGDLPNAEILYRRALAIREAKLPDSIPLSWTYTNLGANAAARNAWSTAREWQEMALAIQQKLLPDSLEVGRTLLNMSDVATNRGDFEEAECLLLRSLDIHRDKAPGSIAEAFSMHFLGTVAANRGRYDEARSWFERSGAQFAATAPESQERMRALAHLGMVQMTIGRLDEAEVVLREAVEAIDRQQERIGGSPEDLAGYRADLLPAYTALTELLVATGREEEAFDVAEASRARGLLALLAGRELDLTEIAPEFDLRRADLARRYDEALEGLAGANDPAERDRWQGEIDRVRLAQLALRDEIRRSSPRLARLRYPEPLRIEEARARLEEGTLVLSWMLGEDATTLFALSCDRFAAVTLETDHVDARRQVERLVRQLSRPDGDGWGERLAAEFVDTFLAPIAPLVPAPKRVLFVPDGPLWNVPFAALPDPWDRSRRFVETRPTSVVASMTVLSELQRSRRPRTTGRVVALGDPAYSSEAASPFRGASGPLGRLPSSREEVEAIERILGPERASVWLGEEATESRAKSSAPSARIVHFAVHGLIDPLFPLESGLAFAPDRGAAPSDNGFLQAWEVIEQLRLEADLVVLSACETATGEEIAGEGIVGLTRAFQYAGARAVLASLWPVADDSTRDLMSRFYEELAAGVATDEALRRAQQAVAAGPGETTGPFHWAGFVLVGDGE